MRFKNYNIINDGKFSVKVTQDVISVASRDFFKDGEVSTKKGDPYSHEDFVGYFSDVGHALSGIVRHSSGRGCDDIAELAAEFRAAVEEIRGMSFESDMSDEARSVSDKS